MQHKSHLALTLAFICQIAVSQNPASQARSAAQATPKLKWVELDGKYKIQVPADFTLGRIDPKITSVPAFYFNARPPDHTSIQVEVLPYDAGGIPINKATGKLVAPANGDLTCEVESLPDPTALKAQGGTPPLTRYFTIADNRDVYYGCTVTDNAYECSMNSPCPLPVRRESRYTTEYAFAVFDKETRLIVELTGSHDGPSKKVTGFKGDGRLLRDTIVPSLTRIK
jgi:hypothetical protein